MSDASAAAHLVPSSMAESPVHPGPGAADARRLVCRAEFLPAPLPVEPCRSAADLSAASPHAAVPEQEERWEQPPRRVPLPLPPGTHSQSRVQPPAQAQPLEPRPPQVPLPPEVLHASPPLDEPQPPDVQPHSQPSASSPPAEQPPRADARSLVLRAACSQLPEPVPAPQSVRSLLAGAQFAAEAPLPSLPASLPLARSSLQPAWPLLVRWSLAVAQPLPRDVTERCAPVPVPASVPGSAASHRPASKCATGQTPASSPQEPSSSWGRASGSDSSAPSPLRPLRSSWSASSSFPGPNRALPEPPE